MDKKHKTPKNETILFTRYYKNKVINEDKLINRFKSAIDSITFNKDRNFSHSIYLDCGNIPKEAITIELKNKLTEVLIDKEVSKWRFMACIHILNDTDEQNRYIKGGLMDVISDRLYEFWESNQ